MDLSQLKKEICDRIESVLAYHQLERGKRLTDSTSVAGATTGTVSVVTASGTLNSNPQFVVMK